MMSPPRRYLERVEIANFRAYGDSFTLSLPKGPGVTLIYGPNGLGKTTFFDAIEWCLTGAIRRFDAYMTSTASRRAAHLTRFGAPEGSHRVGLYFSGAKPIDRGLGIDPAGDEITRILKQPNWPDFTDLGLYLSLTHFLGQSASQRFSVKPPKEQWDALKGPAGVDRINHIRDRLGGHAARLAFNRQINQARQDLEQARAAIANWRAFSEQLQRARSLARVRDAISPSALVATCTELILNLEPQNEPTFHELRDAAPEAYLEITREVVRKVQDLVRSELSGATLLEALAEELDRIATERRELDDLEIAEIAKQEEETVALSHVEEQLRDARARAEDARLRLTSTQAELTLILRLIEASEAYAQNAVRAKRVSDEIAETEARMRVLDDAHSELSLLFRDLTSRAATREKMLRDVTELRAAAQIARDIETRKAEVEKPFLNAHVEEATAQLASRSADLRIRHEALHREVGLIEAELAEIDRRNGTLVALVGQIAGLLREEDAACPVCATVFAPGELIKQVRAVPSSAVSSAQGAGERLATARGELAVVERELKASETEIQKLNAFQRDRKGLADREAALLVRVRDTTALDAKLTSLEDVLQLADTYEQEAAAAELMTLGERSTESCREELRAIERGRNEVAERRTLLQNESGKIAGLMEESRIALTQRSGVWSDTDGLASSVRSDQLAATAALADAQLSAEVANESLRILETQQAAVRARIAESNRVIKMLQQKRSATTRQSEQLAERWAEVAPALQPSRDSVWNFRVGAEERARKVTEVEQQLERVIEGYQAWVDDAERQRLEASFSSHFAVPGITSEEELDAHLLRAVEEAERMVSRLEGTRDAALGIASELQHKADQYAQSVLQPLNETIQSYSRALMTRADASLFYRAQYRANRSELRSGIRWQNVDGSAVTVDMNPNLYFSEGQLSALSVSALLAASTKFRWSQWPALLMDDPLQHNDVIHASAFIDLLRRLVQKLGYQVILSTHDSDEAEFILRKCESAEVAVQLCELRPSRGEGLVSF